MQLNTLIPRTISKKVMIVGRGGKRGKTSGRGGKGQTARAGNKKRPELRDFIKRIPKLRGRGKNSNKTIETKPVAINLDAIEAVFKAGDSITAQTLMEKRLVTTFNGKIPVIKILAGGDITKKYSFAGVIVSAKAKEKIEKAGGSIKA
jgi:large subunit ribosomal protein L15